MLRHELGDAGSARGRESFLDGPLFVAHGLGDLLQDDSGGIVAKVTFATRSEASAMSREPMRSSSFTSWPAAAFFAMPLDHVVKASIHASNVIS